MYPQQGLKAFWPGSGKKNRCGVTAFCLPIPAGPTILLPFRGLRAEGRAQGSPSLSWECFRSVGGTREGVFWFPEDSWDSVPPKLWKRGQRGYLGAWAGRGFTGEVPWSLLYL